ncbi:ABC transporter ATP-binding protein [Thermoplasma sp. Kam2015]|uniref:ABC transporter ATP-binding protein n=1 Tax=Thermoplasma sp. Kam2015 TaxID=2094122 RepID=UPI000D8A042C|nr:ATP-binding cassette domain-containing protein [Thermoplasma sp. Kam2015]PYB68346.1 ABC transporter ATP-binding protein [Thermoplasma sp. Kam2015]
MIEVIKTENVSKVFQMRKGFAAVQNITALNNVNISLSDGEILGLVGASGSGKSTIARILVLLYRPTSGKILFHDRDVSGINGHELKQYRSKVQMVFQDPYASLDPYHTVAWHIRRPLKIIHYKGDVEERIDALLQMVRLDPPGYFRDKFPHQLSGGQRQRVYLARTLALEPEVLIADEPVSMLDVSLRIEILDLLEKIRNDLGISIIYITHDLNTVSMITDRLYVIHNGEIVESGKTEEILSDPKDPYTKSLIAAAPDPYKRI